MSSYSRNSSVIFNLLHCYMFKTFKLLCVVLFARHLLSDFSGKLLTLMPPDALILAQNATKCV